MSKTLLTATALAWALLACNASKLEPSALPPSGDAPVICVTDADCHAGACGPCSPNDPVTHAALYAECVVNPCPGKTAYCSASHACTIR